MKISETWLKNSLTHSQVDNPTITKLSASDIGHMLTMAGLELDDLYKVAPEFCGVVVGQVLSCEQHPDADKLKVTTVDISTGEPLQIVCGAPNVRTGLKVAVATIGAKLPPLQTSQDNKPFSIKKSKLRGIESQGMLCGASELGLTDELDGLLELSDDAPVGEDLRKFLDLDSHIFEIAITPNRGDCLSVRGIARELGVLTNTPMADAFGIQDRKWQDKASTLATLCDAVEVQVMDAVACPRYLAQAIYNIDRSVATPQWLKDRLVASGLRTHNFLVDVTNYVLLELGQPLHAFDADKIVGGIVVRMARQGETVQLLNEQNITLSGDELVIADDVGVLALAGIMGGLRSAVTDTTTNIVLESAHFHQLAIASRARRFGLHTDASQRFERGVDFDLPYTALCRAVTLITDVAGGQLSPVVSVESISDLPIRAPIHVPIARVERLLGVSISTTDIVRILTALQIDTVQNDKTLVCIPPSHRFDLSITEDIIEEVARIYGYDNIAPVMTKLDVDMSRDDSADVLLMLKNTLVAQGYLEAVSFSFSDEKLENLLDDTKLGALLPLANPISSELAVMRRTLLSSLLPIVQYNVNRRQNHLRFFETGLSFVGRDVSELVQTPSLAMVAMGDVLEKQAYANRAYDFYDLKHDVESLLPAHIDMTDVRYERADLAFLHTGQSAYISVRGVRLGWLGQLHPSIAHVLDMPTVWVAQLTTEALIALHQPMAVITTPSRFPSVRRDLAFLVDSQLAWQDLADVVRVSAGEYLSELWLFDIYEGEHLPDGKKSLAFAMNFVHPTATLDDETIKIAMDNIIHALSSQYAAQLRDS